MKYAGFSNATNPTSSSNPPSSTVMTEPEFVGSGFGCGGNGLCSAPRARSMNVDVITAVRIDTNAIDSSMITAPTTRPSAVVGTTSP
ncbi:hypothetical protein Lesp02_59770 [Lentzea sp. NBRC 105346]|nr:hypothetical protein Lesp02_59770 [Lentzea sp. NBRC 105346]